MNPFHAKMDGMERVLVKTKGGLRFQRVNTRINRDILHCKQCDKYLPKAEFYVHKNKRTGRETPDSRCNPCRKVGMILRYRGITRKQYDALMEKWNGSCEVCLKACPRPSIDHDHATGEIRGLLCTACNTALGLYSSNHHTNQQDSL